MYTPFYFTLKLKLYLIDYYYLFFNKVFALCQIWFHECGQCFARLKEWNCVSLGMKRWSRFQFSPPCWKLNGEVCPALLCAHTSLWPDPYLLGCPGNQLHHKSPILVIYTISANLCPTKIIATLKIYVK